MFLQDNTFCFTIMNTSCFRKTFFPQHHEHESLQNNTWVNINGFSVNLVCALILGDPYGQISSSFDRIICPPHIRNFTWVNINRISRNLVCALLLWRVWRYNLGKFRQFLTDLSATPRQWLDITVLRFRLFEQSSIRAILLPPVSALALASASESDPMLKLFCV